MSLWKTRTLKTRLAALALWLCIISFGALPTYADEGLPSGDTCTGTPRQCEQERRDIELCKRQRNIINELNQAIGDYEREIQDSSKAIADMERVIAESRKPGGAPPDPNRLKAQGFAGRGAVGAGNEKGPNIRDAVNYFEHWWHLYHWKHLYDFASNRAKELKDLIAARKKELGLGENDKLPKAEQDALDRKEGPIEMMAMGRANYMFEIERSTIFIGQLRGRINDAKRQIDILVRTGPPNCASASKTPESDGKGKGAPTSSADGSGTATGEPSVGSGGGGPIGPRTAGGGSAKCPTAQAYAYAPGAVIVPGPADPNCGAPCSPLPGWHLPAGARCGGGLANPPKEFRPGGDAKPALGGDGTARPQPSAPSAGSVGGGSCGPAPRCPDGCRPVGYQCLNSKWLGGHCVCSTLP